ncbi:MAG TPA: M10 family metallopeptidase C-terminal domain-containing protein, partial [Allosphingosinicella sp.]
MHVGARGTLAALAADSAGDFGTAFLQPLQTATSAKLTTALPLDGVGDLKPPVLSQLLITTDNVPDEPDTAGNTNPTLTVTPPGTTTPIVSTIDTIGDQDFYKVTLTAGVTYEFGLYSYNGGPNAAGLTDPYLELYGADGTTLIVSADGGADTVYNQVNSGLDVLLTYTPTVSGTYYVNARAYSNSPLTPTGDSVGDYELFVREQDPNDPNIYTPYYEPTEPLYAIDWGTQVNKVNVSARNPDGNEGTRSSGGNGVDPTGNAQGTPVYTSLVDIPALAAAQGKDISGKNVITIYFAKPGDVFVSNDPTNPGLPPATITAVAIQDFEYNAVWTALAEFEKVADVVYLEVQDRDHADFIYTSYQGTPGPGISLLGSMSPPDESDEGLAQFNSGDERWNARDLAQGGFSFVTLIHEFGHGHGLAHPHDNGGRSGIMNGVEPEGTGVANYTTGDYELNQGVFTMMSYEDGWQSSPYGNASTTAGYGYLGGLMAFDIAAIQDKYGVNESYNTGNNIYTMEDVNAAGTYFTSIWDGGGTDEIVYSGARDTTIDLRQATLKYEVGGGGFVSFAYGIYGGYTIANGVTIENATSGSGHDKLTGNSADNRLDAGAGNDNLYLWFGGGNDTALGGAGNDNFFFGATLTPADIVTGGADYDTLVIQGDYAGGLTLSANVTGLEALSVLGGNNTAFGEPGTNLYDYSLTTHNANFAAGVQARINASALQPGEDFTFNGSAETDASFVVYGGRGKDTLLGGLGNDIFFFDTGRFASGDTVNGGPGYDGMFLRGNYTIDFNAPGYTGLFTNIENLTLTSATDERYARGGGTEFDYNLILSNALVGAGQTLTVSGALLKANETMVLDGSQETDGLLRLFGGAAADTLKGGSQADTLHGNLGADLMTGGGGADKFLYNKSAESTSASMDQILDFAAGTDKVDLGKIDANTLAAGDQAFTWIGSNAFGGTGAASAGQLRAYQSNGSWFVEGDTNGDGTADLVIA